MHGYGVDDHHSLRILTDGCFVWASASPRVVVGIDEDDVLCRLCGYPLAEIAHEGTFVLAEDAAKLMLHGEDFVDFEYTEGTGFDKILDGFLKKNDEDGFRKAVSDFFAELDKIATAEFHQNEKTIEVFGENTFVEGEKAIPAGNIDLIFQNVIVDSNGKWNVIDY